MRYLSRSAFTRGIPAALALAALTIKGDSGQARGKASLALVGLLAAGVVVVGGDWMAHQRLLLPIGAPLISLAAAAALSLTIARSRPTALAAALLGVVAIVSWPGGADLGRLVTLRLADPRSAQEGTMVDAQRRAAHFVVQHADEGDLVAVNHAGAFGFEAEELEILDMVGLTDRHIARSAPGEGLHRRFDLDYVVQREPSWVILNSRERPEHGVYPGDYWPGETMLARSPYFRSRCVQVHVEQWEWDLHPESFVIVYRCEATAAANLSM